MSLDFSDPRPTAYALDELDAAERAEVEAELAGDPERRRLVDEICATARLLTEHFQSYPRPTAYALDELDAAERAEVEAELAGDPERRRLVEDFRATAASYRALRKRTAPYAHPPSGVE